MPGGGSLFQSCTVAGCAKEHGADDCFQCAEFPCEVHGMPGKLADVWRANNGKRRECGPVTTIGNSRISRDIHNR